MAHAQPPRIPSLYAPLCPRCGSPNECAVSACGSFDVDCWCRSVRFAPRPPGASLAEAEAASCLCRLCAAGADAGSQAEATAPAPVPEAVGVPVLRPARPSDALCLSVLASQVFLDTYATQGIRPAIAREVVGGCSEAVFDAALRDPARRLTVAERDGHLLGFAQLVIGARHDVAPAGAASELLRLYVQRLFMGQGIGTRLLRAAEGQARQAGNAVLWLTAWVGNHHALAFYRRRGFQDHGRTQHVFEGESYENRLLVRRLSDDAGAP